MSLDPAIEPKLAAYLQQLWGAPVAISGLRRFHGGAARETMRFDATPEGGAPRGLVLRRDPPSSLIETDRRVEYAALAAFAASAVPVPEVIAVEGGPEAFGSPGFLMAEVPGVRAAGLFEPDPYGAARESVGRDFFTILGRIHAAPLDAIADLPGADDPRPAWARRLAHWEAAIDADALGPEPIVRAGIRWLKASPPPPPQRPAIVHGDYRSGNFLVDADNRIRAIVDWEMVHAGDPLEDLAWACDALWSHGTPERPAGTLPLAEAVAVWEAASGLRCDPDAFRWWRIFAQVMGLAIWISAGREVASGRNADPVNVFAAIYPYRFHNRTLAHALREMAAEETGS